MEGISILLAVYNGEKYIKKSIDSILSQNYKDFELLIGFNGTTDSSKEIVEKYKDDRIKIFDYIEKGKAKTLNKLIKESKYNWIAVQDHDDVWLPNKLHKQLKFMEEYDIIGTQILYIDEGGNLTGSGPNLSLDDYNIKQRSLNGDNQIANTSAIVKKQSILDVEGWNEEIDGIEDFDLWLKLISKNNKFININEHLILHRVHSNSNFNTKTFNIHELIKKYNSK